MAGAKEDGDGAPSTSAELLQDLPLAAAYARANELIEQLKRKSDEQLRREALSLLQRCEDQVDRAAVFSSNEEADDVATEYLRYLLLPALRAELLGSAPAGAKTG